MVTALSAPQVVVPKAPDIPGQAVAVAPVALAVADLNGDGIPDLLYGFEYSSGVNQGPYSVVTRFVSGHGDGTFNSSPTFVSSFSSALVPTVTDLVVADFNGDGKLDILGSFPGGIGVALGNGNGTFQHPVIAPVPSNTPFAGPLLVGDFVGNGSPGFVVGGRFPVQASPPLLFAGNGDGTFRTGVLLSSQASLWAASFAADLNGDGLLDLFGASQYPNGIFLGSFLRTRGAPGDFVGSVSPHVQPVPAGTAVTFTISLSPLSGPNGDVSLTVAGLPPGATAMINPQVIPGASGSAVVTVSTSPRTQTGSYPLTIQATSGTVVHRTNVTIIVNATVGDFTGTFSSVRQSAVVGGAASYTFNLTPIGGFTGDVTLSVEGLPAGVTPGFNNNPITGGVGSSVLTLNASGSAAPGTYTFSMVGTSGTLVHKALLTLDVQASAGDFTGFISPTTDTISRGQSASYDVHVIPLQGFTGDVLLSVNGLPPGATAGFAPSTVAGGSGVSTLTISTTAGAPPGAYTITVSGTSGSLVHRGTTTLFVN
jgi:hypothetical protein